MDLRLQLAFLRSSLPLVVIGALLGAVAAFLVSSVMPPVYQSQVTLLVGQPANTGTSADYNQLLISQRLSQTYAQIVTLPEVATRVIDRLDLSTTPEELLKRVNAEVPLDSTLLTIIAEDGTARAAADLANAFAEELLASPVVQPGTPTEIELLIQEDLIAVREQTQQVQDQIDALIATPNRTDVQEQRLAVLQGQIIGLRQTLATLLSLSTAPNASQLTVVDPARPPLGASSPRVLLNTGLGGLLGLLAGIGVAYTMRRLDDTIKSPEEMELVTGLPLLGTIVRMPGDRDRAPRYRLATLLYPRSPAAEGFRHVRTNLDFAIGENPLRSLLVASAVPGEGKTVATSNLAVAFAQAGRTVCLVDADLRRPTIHDVFGLPNEHGLSSLLRGEQLSYESATHPTEVTGLRILTTGPLPPNPAELLASDRMRAIVASLLKKVDVIVIDSPPLQAVTDAIILSSLVDGTLLVTRSGQTGRGTLLRGRDALQRVGARILGTMLNGVEEGPDTRASFTYFGYYGQAGPSADISAQSMPVFSTSRSGRNRREATDLNGHQGAEPAPAEEPATPSDAAPLTGRSWAIDADDEPLASDRPDADGTPDDAIDASPSDESHDTDTVEAPVEPEAAAPAQPPARASRRSRSSRRSSST